MGSLSSGALTGVKNHAMLANTRTRIVYALIAWHLCAGSAQASTLLATVHDSQGKPVADAVVVASPSDGATTTTAGAAVEVDQQGMEFTPYVTAISVGTVVHFPNKDPVRHHVYSFSPPKKFNLPLYSGSSSEPVVFDKAGVVALGCNIHDWMIGFIYVADSPYFGKTGGAGQVTIDQLPAGNYSVRIWHPRMQQTESSTIKAIEIEAGSSVEMSWQIAVAPLYKPRRAPLQNGGGY